MDTYLFSWNPTKWAWKIYGQSVAELEDGAIITKNMHCINYKNIAPAIGLF